VGPKQVFAKDQYKAFGRFVRERFDDFAWENDLIAHRTYGKALETWKGEPLTSSTIDIWSKRTPKMVINDWYLADDYHSITAKARITIPRAKSRGCGGNGIWENGKLLTSSNFIDSNVLANGPIRILFELKYALMEMWREKPSASPWTRASSSSLRKPLQVWPAERPASPSV